MNIVSINYVLSTYDFLLIIQTFYRNCIDTIWRMTYSTYLDCLIDQKMSLIVYISILIAGISHSILCLMNRYLTDKYAHK